VLLPTHLSKQDRESATL